MLSRCPALYIWQFGFEPYLDSNSQYLQGQRLSFKMTQPPTSPDVTPKHQPFLELLRTLIRQISVHGLTQTIMSGKPSVKQCRSVSKDISDPGLKHEGWKRGEKGGESGIKIDLEAKDWAFLKADVHWLYNGHKQDFVVFENIRVKECGRNYIRWQPSSGGLLPGAQAKEKL